MTTPILKPSASLLFPSLRNLFPNPSVTSLAGLHADPSQATLAHISGAARWTLTTTSPVGINLPGQFPATGTGIRLLVRARANKTLGARARVRGTESASNVATLTTAWQWIDYTAVAGSGNANTTGLVLRSGGYVAGDWIEIDRVLVALTPDSGPWAAGLLVPITDGEARLDASRTVYGDMALTVPLVDLDILDDLDPRTPLRMVVTMGLEGEAPRSFDMHLRERVVDHRAGTMTLRGATDEALLQDWTPAAVDAAPRAHEGSIRALVNYMLSQAIPGAALVPGPDAAVPAFWPITNFVPNPSLETDATGWLAGTGASALTRTNATALAGAWSLRWTAAAGDSNVVPVPGSGSFYTVKPGQSYVFAASTASGTSRTARMAIQWWTQGGSTPVTTSWGATYTSHSGAFTRGYVIATCPPGCDRALPYVNTSGNTSGNTHYVDAAAFYEGDEAIPYFDGATADDAHYEYGWTAAAAHGSPSTRTPLLERRPERFVWTPAVTAWDFLEPLTASVGMKLYCDEQRRWHLIDPATETRPGRITVAEGYNAVEGSDTLTRAADDYCTLLVVRYRWRDADGIQQERFETAGVPGKTVIIDVPGAPTPGLAAQILRNKQGRGRRQDVTGLMQPEATPWQEISITLPGTTGQLGRIQSVSWSLSSGLMTLGSTGLTELPAGSIDALTGTIDSLTGTIDSL